jgi:hypothetical protein
MQKKIHYIILSFLFSVILLIIFILFYFEKNFFFEKILQIGELKNKISDEKWNYFRLIFTFFLGIFLVLFYFFYSKIIAFFQKIIDLYVFLFQKIIIFLSNQSKKNINIFFTSFLFLSSFHFIQIFFYPYLLDEIFAYTFLLHRGFLGIYPYYPGPNQHILFHLGSYFLSFIPIFTQNPVLYLRFFSFLGFFITLLSVSLWVWKVKNLYVSVLIMSFFAFFPPNLVYGFLGRGYSWQLFFTLLGVYFCAKIEEKAIKSLKSLYVLGFIFSQIIGLGIIPTHLFVVIGFLLVFILKRNKSTFYIFFSIFFSVFLLYLPVILFNGYTVLLKNDWIKPLSFFTFWAEFLPYFIRLNNYFFIDIPFIFGLFLIIGLFFMYQKRQSIYATIMFCMGISVIFLCVFRLNLPPERVFTYFIFGFLYCILKIYESLSKQKINTLFLFLPSFFCIFLHFYSFPPQNPAHILSKSIIKKEKTLEIFTDDDVLQVFLKYENIEKKGKNQIYFLDFIPEKKYDFCIILKENQKKYDFITKKYPNKIFFDKYLILKI